MIKGCVQLGQVPDIYNTVNMVPVDHVARVVVAAAFNPPASPLAVAHVTSHPRLRFNEFLSTLITYGYGVDTVDYVPWRIALERHVVEKSKDNALYVPIPTIALISGNFLIGLYSFPLLHFVLDNLPQSTKAPELDDSNSVAALKADRRWTSEDVSSGAGVSVEQMGIYLAYLIAIGFLPAPPATPNPGKGRLQLPTISLSETAKKGLAAVGGRGGLV